MFMAGKSVLLFELPFAEEMRISAFCRAHGEAVRAIPRGEYGRTLGQIAGTGNFPGLFGFAGNNGRPGRDRAAASAASGSGAEAEIPGAPMMVFAGFTPGELENVLTAMSEEKLPVVELKAMLTPVSAMWTPGQLYRNLAEEHAAMTGQRPGRNGKDTEE
jgi:hypothetical protein